MPAYDSNVARGNDFSLSAFLPRTAGATITAPTALITGNITETTSNLQQSSGTPLGFVAAAAITIQRFWIGINAAGKPSISALSTPLAYTAVGTGATLKITSTPPAGVIGQGIVIKTPAMPVARVAGFFPYWMTVVPISQVPNGLALDTTQAGALSATLVEGNLIQLPALIASPTKTVMNKLIENEIHNEAMQRRISASSLKVSGELLSPQIDFAQLLTGGGFVYEEGTTIKQGQAGYKRGTSQNDIWFELVENGDAVNTSQYQYFLGTFAKDSTERAMEKGNIPFEVSQQPFSLFRGHESIFWAQAA